MEDQTAQADTEGDRYQDGEAVAAGQGKHRDDREECGAESVGRDQE